MTRVIVHSNPLAARSIRFAIVATACVVLGRGLGGRAGPPRAGGPNRHRHPDTHRIRSPDRSRRPAVRRRPTRRRSRLR